jgi:hypothetical protein
MPPTHPQRLVEKLVPLPPRPGPGSVAPSLSQPTIGEVGKQDSGVLLAPLKGTHSTTTGREESDADQARQRKAIATVPAAKAGQDPEGVEEATYQRHLQTQLKNRVKAQVSLWKLYSFTVTSLLGALVLGNTTWAWHPSQYFVDFHLPPT